MTFAQKLKEVFVPAKDPDVPLAQEEQATAPPTDQEVQLSEYDVSNDQDFARGPLTYRDIKRQYQRPSSFINRLPWYEYQSESQTFLLDDGRSVAAIYDVIPLSTEGRSYGWLQDKRDVFQDCLQDTFEEYGDSPWILQQYAYDDDDMGDFIDLMRRYPDQRCISDPYTLEYLDNMTRHLESISKEGGLFEDTEVLGADWGGKIRRVKMICYRRLPANYKPYAGMTPEEELNDTMDKMEKSFEKAGIGLVRCDHRGFHDWMLAWFNPNPEVTNGDRKAFRELVGYSDPNDLPAGDDLAESFFFELPKSNAKSQTWTFNGMPHRCLRVHKLRRAPKIGQVCGEVMDVSSGTEKDGKANCMLDEMPPGTIVATTIVISAQDKIRQHVDRIQEKAKGESVDAEHTRRACDEAKDIMGGGQKLYRSMMAVYLRAKDLRELRKRTNKASTVLLTNHLSPVREEDESLGLDAYVFNLPMCYEVGMDKDFKAVRPIWAQHVASLSSVFGRHRGTGNPGFTFFNRGGEPLTFDPFSQDDRKKNGHGLILGPTGAGKSALVTAIASQNMAMLRPRLFIVEAGNSFGLLADYFQTRGMTVNKVSLKPGAGVSMPPFADAHRCLTQKHMEEMPEDLSESAMITDEDIKSFLPDDFDQLTIHEKQDARRKAALDAVASQFSDDSNDDDDEEDVERDVMGEMEIIATLMITGGEEEEAKKLTRADRRMIRDAILLAAKSATSQGRITLTEDVAEAFRILSTDNELPETRRLRIFDMGEAIRMFTDGFEGEVFNTIGKSWPDTDVTIVDLATFAREGYGAQLAIAYTSIMMRINNLAEQHQHDDRPIVMLTDEGHIITTNPLLAPFVVKVVKMWRKLGAWWWVATQNMEDFPQSAKKMLNMIEWWICLVMPQEEINEIARFKSLTEEQRHLMLSAKKEPKKYTEGVILSEKVEALFRSVPPSIYLSLAMTEKHEKAERAKYMREFGISEVEAAEYVAKMLDFRRGIGEKPADPVPREKA